MIHREWIIWMALQYLIELLNRTVVIHVVEVVEGRAIQRVVGTERETVSGRDRSRICLGSCRMGQNRAEEQIAINHHAGKQNGIPLVQFCVLSLSDARAAESMEPRTSIRLDICQSEASSEPAYSKTGHLCRERGNYCPARARWEQI